MGGLVRWGLGDCGDRGIGEVGGLRRWGIGDWRGREVGIGEIGELGRWGTAEMRDWELRTGQVGELWKWEIGKVGGGGLATPHDQWIRLTVHWPDSGIGPPGGGSVSGEMPESGPRSWSGRLVSRRH